MRKRPCYPRHDLNSLNSLSEQNCNWRVQSITFKLPGAVDECDGDFATVRKSGTHSTTAFDRDVAVVKFVSWTRKTAIKLIPPCSDFRLPFILIRRFMLAHLPHEVLEALEDPDPDLFRRSRARFHYRECRQRCRRHLDLFVRRRALWPHPAVDHDPRYHCSHRGAGDDGSHGSDHEQGPQRSDSRGVWIPHHVLHDDRHPDHEL